MASPHVTSLAAFYMSVLGADYGRLAEEGALKCHLAVVFFVNAASEATKVSKTSLCGPADHAYGTLLRHMQNRSLGRDEACDLIANCRVVIVDEVQSHTHLCPLDTTVTCPILSQISTRLVNTHETGRK